MLRTTSFSDPELQSSTVAGRGAFLDMIDELGEVIE